MGTHLTMVIIFLLLGFTLSFIQSQFTAFHPVQVEFVHAKDGSFHKTSPVLGNPINPITPRLAFGNQEPPKFPVPTGLPLSFLQKVKIASPVKGNPINPRLAFGNQEPPKFSVPTGLPLSFPQKVKIASPVQGNPINPINPRLAFGNQEPPKFSVPTGLPLSFLQKVKIASPVQGNPINPRLAFGNQEPQRFSVPTGLPLSTGNIVEQSEAASENVKSLLIFLGNITIVPEVFSHVFRSNGCLENIQDAAELMDNSYELVAKNAPEIIYLEAIIENLMHEKNITKLLRVSSKMLRLFEDLIPKLPVKIEKRCFSSLRDSAADFKGLAHLLIDVLNHRDINLPEESRQLIQRRTKTMSATSKFLVIINKSLTIFESLCNHKQSRYTAANKSLAALYEVLGSESKSKDVMRQGDIIMRILVSK